VRANCCTEDQRLARHSLVQPLGSEKTHALGIVKVPLVVGVADHFGFFEQGGVRVGSEPLPPHRLNRIESLEPCTFHTAGNGASSDVAPGAPGLSVLHDEAVSPQLARNLECVGLPAERSGVDHARVAKRSPGGSDGRHDLRLRTPSFDRLDGEDPESRGKTDDTFHVASIPYHSLALRRLRLPAFQIAYPRCVFEQHHPLTVDS
jgi:hypothetical protein